MRIKRFTKNSLISEQVIFAIMLIITVPRMHFCIVFISYLLRTFSDELLCVCTQQKSEPCSEIILSRIRTRLFSDSEDGDDATEQRCSSLPDSDSAQRSVVNGLASSGPKSTVDCILMDDVV